MAEIKLENIGISYDGKTKVIDNLNLIIPNGSFTVFVGPSGSGKSTLLRTIAGLEGVTEGNILIDGKKVNDFEPGERDIAMVFQNYALYPTMSVRQNMEFGLENAKMPKKDRKELVEDVAEMLGLTEYLDRKPRALSGGQRQRVALGRALVKKPKAFLLDEPLSNLDAKLRNQMRFEITQLHKRLGTTFIYVTHDQVEAMSMGDKIVLLNYGEIMAEGTPDELYHTPKNVFTAQFIGTPSMNIFSEANSLTFSNSKYKKVGIRPEKIHLIQTDTLDYDRKLEGKVISIENLGSETLFTIQFNEENLLVKVYEHESVKLDQMVSIGFNNKDLYYYDDSQNLVLDKGGE